MPAFIRINDVVIRHTVIEIINARPPIVGVPDLERCQEGPSSYIGCLVLEESRGISFLSISRVDMPTKRNDNTDIAILFIFASPLISQ
jgi:hypothetical protein